MEDFYRICVAVPLTMAAIPCDLYLCRKPDSVLELVCSCDCGVLLRPEPAVWPVYLSEISYIDGGHFVAPIFSHHSAIQGGLIQGGAAGRQQEGRGLRLLGMFVVRCNDRLNENDRFFLDKYVNRIAYNLDNHLLAQ